MNPDELRELLMELGACKEAVQWAKGKSLTEVWSSCERGDWMLWLCARMCDKDGWPSRKKLVLAVCICAETVLPLFEKKYPTDKRPRVAIETARQWAKGKATIKEVRPIAAVHAAYAAYDVYAAVYAAYAATYAAYAASAAAYAASTTSFATYASYAVSTAAYAASYAYGVAAFKEYAELVRKELYIPRGKVVATRRERGE